MADKKLDIDEAMEFRNKWWDVFVLSFVVGTTEDSVWQMLSAALSQFTDQIVDIEPSLFDYVERTWGVYENYLDSKVTWNEEPDPEKEMHIVMILEKYELNRLKEFYDEYLLR